MPIPKRTIQEENIQLDPSTNLAYNPTEDAEWVSSAKALSPRELTEQERMYQMMPDPDIGLGESSYDKDFVVTPFSTKKDLNEFRAAKQGFGNKLANSVAQLLANAGTTIVDDYIGTAFGIGQGVYESFDDDISRGFITGFTQNKVSEGLNEARKEIMKAFPIYETEESREGFDLGNWFATTLASSGYFIGSAIGSKGFNPLITKAFKIPKLANAFGKSLVKKGLAKDVTEALIKARKGTISYADMTDDIIKASKKLKRAEVAAQYTAAGLGVQSEARMQGINAKEDYIAKMTPEAQKRASERAMDRMNNEDISNYENLQEAYEAIYKEEFNREQAKLKDYGEKIGNLSYAMNVPVLAGANMIQIGKSLKPGYITEKSMFKDLIKGNFKEGFELGKVPKIQQTLGAIFKPTSEMLEEIGQLGIDEANIDYFSRKYEKGEGSIGSAIDATFDKMTSLQALKEGLSGFVMGGVGIPLKKTTNITKATYDENGNLLSPEKREKAWQMEGGIFSNLRENKEKLDRTKKLVEYKNSLLEEYSDEIKYLNTANSLTADKRKALSEDDKFKYKTLEDDELVNLATKAVNSGDYQEVRDFFEGFTNVTEEDAAWIRENSKVRPNDKSKEINKKHNEEVKSVLDSASSKEVGDIIEQIRNNSYEKTPESEKLYSENAKEIGDLLTSISTLDNKYQQDIQENAKVAEKDSKDSYAHLSSDSELANHINNTNKKVIKRLDKLNELWADIDSRVGNTVSNNAKELILRSAYQADRMDERANAIVESLEKNAKSYDPREVKDIYENLEKRKDLEGYIEFQRQRQIQLKALETRNKNSLFKKADKLLNVSKKEEELTKNIEEESTKLENDIEEANKELEELNSLVNEDATKLLKPIISQFEKDKDSLQEESLEEVVSLTENLENLYIASQEGDFKAFKQISQDFKKQLNKFESQKNKGKLIKNFEKNQDIYEDKYFEKINKEFELKEKDITEKYESDIKNAKEEVEERKKLEEVFKENIKQLKKEKKDKKQKLEKYLNKAVKQFDKIDKSKEKLNKTLNEREQKLNEVLKEAGLVKEGIDYNTETLSKLEEEDNKYKSQIHSQAEKEGKDIIEFHNEIVDIIKREKELKSKLAEEERLNPNIDEVSKDLKDLRNLISTRQKFADSYLRAIRNPQSLEDKIEDERLLNQQIAEEEKLNKEINKIKNAIRPNIEYANADDSERYRLDEDNNFIRLTLDEEGKVVEEDVIEDEDILEIGDLFPIKKLAVPDNAKEVTTPQGDKGYLTFEEKEELQRLIKSARDNEIFEKATKEEEGEIEPVDEAKTLDVNTQEELEESTKGSAYEDLEKKPYEVKSFFKKADGEYGSKWDKAINETDLVNINKIVKNTTGKTIEEHMEDSPYRNYAQINLGENVIKEYSALRPLTTAKGKLFVRKPLKKRAYKYIRVWKYAGKNKEGEAKWKYPKGTKNGKLWGKLAKQVKYKGKTSNGHLVVDFDGETWYATVKEAKFAPSPNEPFGYYKYRQRKYQPLKDGTYKEVNPYKKEDDLKTFSKEEFKQLPRLQINGEKVEDFEYKDGNVSVTTPKPAFTKRDTETGEFTKDNLKIPTSETLEGYEVLEELTNGYIVSNHGIKGFVPKTAIFEDLFGKKAVLTRKQVANFIDKNKLQQEAEDSKSHIIQDIDVTEEIASSENKKVKFKTGTNGILNQTRTFIGRTDKDNIFQPSDGEVKTLWEKVTNKEKGAIDEFQNHHTVRSQNWINNTKDTELHKHTLTVVRGEDLGFTDYRENALFGVMTNMAGEYITNTWSNDEYASSKTTNLNEEGLVIQPLGLPDELNVDSGFIKLGNFEQHEDSSKEAQSEVDRYEHTYKVLKKFAKDKDFQRLKIARKITGRSLQSEERGVRDVFKNTDDFELGIITANNTIDFEGRTFVGNPGEILAFNKKTGNVHYLKSRRLNDNDALLLQRILEAHISNMKLDEKGKVDLTNSTTLLENHRLDESLNNIVFTQDKDNLNRLGKQKYQELKEELDELDSIWHFNSYVFQVDADKREERAEALEEYENIKHFIEQLLRNTPEEYQATNPNNTFHFSKSGFPGGDITILGKTVHLLDEAALKEERLELNKEALPLLKEYASKKRNQVKASYLKKTDEKYKVLELNDKGELVSNEYESYEAYIWSKILTTKDVENTNFQNTGATLPTHLNQYLTFITNSEWYGSKKKKDKENKKKKTLLNLDALQKLEKETKEMEASKSGSEIMKTRYITTIANQLTLKALYKSKTYPNTDKDFDKLRKLEDKKELTKDDINWLEEKIHEYELPVKILTQKNFTNANKSATIDKEESATIESTVKPNELDNNAIDNHYANNNDEDNTPPSFRLSETFEGEENFEALEKWWSERFDVPLKIVEPIVNSNLQGYVNGGVAYITNNAEIGTGYHEAFEIVFGNLLTKEEQQRLIKEAENDPYYKDKIDKQSKLYKGKSENTIIKEAIAEEFRDWKLDNGKGLRSKYRNKNKNLFRRLVNFFRRISNWFDTFVKTHFDTTETGIEDIFNRMESGYYKHLPIVNTKYYAERVIEYSDGGKETEDFTNALMKTLNYFFFNSLYQDKTGGELMKAMKKSISPKQMETELLILKDKLNQLGSWFNSEYHRHQELISKETNSDEIKELQKLSSIHNERRTLFIKLYNEFNTPNGIAQRFVEQLSSFGFEEFDEDTAKEGITTGDQTGGRDSNIYISNASLRMSAKSSTSKIIKFMLSTIPITTNIELENKKGEITVKRIPEFDKYGFYKTVDFNTAFGVIINKMEGTVSMSQMEKILEKLASTHKNLGWLNRVLDRLFTSSAAEQALSMEQLLTIHQFNQAFGKNKNVMKTLIMGAEGFYAAIDSNIDTVDARIRNQWATNSLSNKNKLLNNKEYYKYSKFPKTFKKLITTIRDAIGYQEKAKIAAKQLKTLGIEFTFNLDNLGDKDAATIVEITSQIVNQITKGNVPYLFSTEIDSDNESNLRKLAAIEAKYGVDTVENSYFDAEGNLIYLNTLNNSMTTAINRINWIKKNSSSKKEFYNSLNKWYGFSKDTTGMENSWLLDNLWDIDLKYQTFDAVREQKSGSTMQFNKMDSPERFWLWFNRHLEGAYYALRPADNGREKFLTLGKNSKPIFNVSNIENEKHIDTLVGYLKDELYYRISYDWSRFKHADKNSHKGAVIDIIRNSEDSKLIKSLDRVLSNKKIGNFLAYNEKKIRKLFKNYFLRQSYSLLHGNEIFNLANSELVTYNHNTKKYDIKGLNLRSGIKQEKDLMVSEKRLLKEIESFVASCFVSSVEQNKFFLSDIMFAKNLPDRYKRIQGVHGTKKNSVAAHKDNVYEKEFRRIFKFTDGSENNHDYRGKAYQNTMVTSDDVFISKYKFLKNNNTGEKDDGQSLVTMDYYRHHHARSGDWNIDSEIQYQYLMQKEMLFQVLENKYSLKEWNRLFADNYGEELTEKQITPDFVTNKYNDGFKPKFRGEVIKYNKINAKINSIKSQGYGFLTYTEKDLRNKSLTPNGVAFMLKTSDFIIAPTLYRNFKTGEIINKNFYHFTTHARRNNYGRLASYSSVKGASHLLQKNGKDVDKYIVKDGKGNWNFPEKPTLNRLNWEFIGTQLDTGFSTHDKQPNGTQYNKQIFNNIYSNGLPISEELAKKLRKSDSYNNRRLELAKELLIEELGLERQSNGSYKTVDSSKLIDSLLREAKSRQTADNVIDAINLLRTTKDNDALPVESILSKTSVEFILYSLADKRTIGRKLTGKPSYQVSSSGFEGHDIEIIEKNGKQYTGSGSLKFYEVEESDGKTTITSMQVLIPSYLKGVFDKGKVDERLLKLIGFRIPTQGLNSIESIEVAGFLPQEYGDVIVVPSEIILKAGSDFDIDKLNIFIPNSYINTNGEHIYIDDNTNYQDYLSNTFIKINNKLKRDIKRVMSKEVTNMTTDILSGKNISELVKQSALSELENIIEELDTVTATDVTEYKAQIESITELLLNKNATFSNIDKILSEKEFKLLQLENMMLENWGEIITHPDNFQQLITSVEAGSLKDIKLIDEMLRTDYLSEDRLESMLSLNNSQELLLEEAKNWEKSQEEEFNYTKIAEPFNNDAMSRQNMEGAGTISIAALVSTFHIHGQRNGLYFNNENIDVKKWNKDNEEFEVVTESVPINLPHSKINGKPSLGASKDANGNFIYHTLTKIITATVDNAKEAILGDLNWGLKNFSTVTMLAHIGVPEDVLNVFFNQPIIKYYNRLQEIKESPIQMVNDTFSFKDDIVEEVLEKFEWEDKSIKTVLTEENYDSVKKDLILAQYKGNQEIDAYVRGLTKKERKLQLSIFQDFLRYQDLQRYYTQAIQSIKYDTAAPKTTDESWYQQLLTIKVMNDGVIGNYGNVVGLTRDSGGSIVEMPENSSEFKRGFLAPYKKIRKEISEMYKDFFITSKVPVIRNYFNNIVNIYSDILLSIPQDRVNDILAKFKGELITYFMMSNNIRIPKQNDNSNSYTFNLSEEMSNLMSGKGRKSYNSVTELLNDSTLSVPKKIQMIKNAIKAVDENRANKLEQELYRLYGDNELISDLVVFIRNDFDNMKLTDTKIKDAVKLNSLTSNWRHMFSLNNTLGLDLMKFVIVQSGVNPGVLNFIHLAPAEEYSKLFKDILRTIENKSYAELQQDLDTAWKLHKFVYFNNKDLVHKISARQIKKRDQGRVKTTSTGMPVTTMAINIKHKGTETVANVKRTKFETYIYDIYDLKNPLLKVSKYFNFRKNKECRPYISKFRKLVDDVKSLDRYVGKNSHTDISELIKDSNILEYKLSKSEGTVDNPMIGDIWNQEGYKVVSTNLDGIYGAGLAKQAVDKGYIKRRKNTRFKESNFEDKVLSLAVKGNAPETAKVKGQAWSEKVEGGNLELLRQELKELEHFANTHPNELIYVPYVGIGYGEGNAAEILPLLRNLDVIPNIIMIERSKQAAKKYKTGAKVREDNSSQVLKQLRDIQSLKDKYKNQLSNNILNTPNEALLAEYNNIGFDITLEEFINNKHCN